MPNPPVDPALEERPRRDRYVTFLAVGGDKTYELRATCAGWPDPAEVERFKTITADYFTFEHGTFPDRVNVSDEPMIEGQDYAPVHGALAGGLPTIRERDFLEHLNNPEIQERLARVKEISRKRRAGNG